MEGCFVLSLLFSLVLLTLGDLPHTFFKICKMNRGTPRRDEVLLWFVWQKKEQLGERFSFILKIILKKSREKFIL